MTSNKVRSEYQFSIIPENKDQIIELLQKCGIENFWYVELDDLIMFSVESDNEKLDAFNEGRKILRGE